MHFMFGKKLRLIKTICFITKIFFFQDYCLINFVKCLHSIKLYFQPVYTLRLHISVCLCICISISQSLFFFLPEIRGRMELVTFIGSNSKCYLSDDGLIDSTCFRYIEYVSYYCIIFYIYLCIQNKVFFELIDLISANNKSFQSALSRP